MALLPFRRLLLAGVLVTWAAALLSGASAEPGERVRLDQAPGELGVFDPSLARAGDGVLAMSFSAVHPDPDQPTPHDRHVSIHLARSTDGGHSWSVLGEPVFETTRSRDGSQAVTWHHEVSTLAHLPGEADVGMWHVMAHHYPVIGGKLRFEFGWMALKSATTLEGLPDAREVKLFAGRAFRERTDAPVSGRPLSMVRDLHKDFSRCIALTEPGLAAQEGMLYLAMSCVEGRLFGAPTPKVVLLACNAPCRPGRASAWRYVSTLLRAEDAKAEDRLFYTAPALVLEDGRAGLIATPTANTPFKGAYRGCSVFRFEDLPRGRLQRDADGPEIIRRADGTAGSFNGACDAVPGSDAMLLSQLEIRGGSPVFTIRRLAE